MLSKTYEQRPGCVPLATKHDNQLKSSSFFFTFCKFTWNRITLTCSVVSLNKIKTEHNGFRYRNVSWYKSPFTCKSKLHNEFYSLTKIWKNKHLGKLLKTNHLLPLEEEVHCVVPFEEKKIKSSAFICFLIFVVWKSVRKSLMKHSDCYHPIKN